MNLSPYEIVLLDIEGTTTPIAFVYDVLFPYARRKIADFLNRHLTSAEVRADLARLRDEREADFRQGLDPPPYDDDSREKLRESAVSYLHWLMDSDRKSTPLKALQGKVWEEGYRAGELKSRVFADVPRAFELWRDRSIQIYIFSSGSVLAQKLLFAHTEAGDLTGFISGYFDTNIGPKSDAESYRRIADAVKTAPPKIVFVSDVTKELAAAREAGMQAVLAVRPGNHPQQDSASYPVVTTLDDLF
jgi:enolase-phosphatase E1